MTAPHARFGQVTKVGAVVFHCERRARVLLREVFRFGTATVLLLTCIAGRHRQVCQRRPARVDLVVSMTGRQIIQPLPAF